MWQIDPESEWSLWFDSDIVGCLHYKYGLVYTKESLNPFVTDDSIVLKCPSRNLLFKSFLVLKMYAMSKDILETWTDTDFFFFLFN